MTEAGQLSSKLDPVARAHAQLLAQTDLQFAFSGPPKIPPPPDWLMKLMRWLAHAAPALKWVFWAGVVLLVGLVVFFILREVVGLRWTGRRGKAGAAHPGLQEDWRPSAARARTLLEDADRLAAEGRYDEAVHLILFRSIEDIEQRWPRLVQPALTSRDIAVHPQLPMAARSTFAAIARTVERSFFGGEAIGREAFEACRQDYRAFALPVGA